MSAHEKSGCPLCGRAIGEQPRKLEVCRPCADGMDRLHRHVASTGEFTAVTDEDLAALRAASQDAPRSPSPRSPEAIAAAADKRCFGCGRPRDEVMKLLESPARTSPSGHAAPGMLICNECVSFCADILETELGQKWRG